MIRPLAALRVVVALIGLAPAAPIPRHLMSKEPPFNYPTALGTKWVYELEGGGEYTETVTEVEEKNGATFLTIDATPVERKLGRSVLAVTQDGVYIHAQDGEACDPPLLCFKLPCRAGDTWTSTLTRPEFNVSVRYTVGPVEKIKVSAGEFSALRVDIEMTFNGVRKLTRVQWFASGIGTVKTEGGWVLKSFTPGKD